MFRRNDLCIILTIAADLSYSACPLVLSNSVQLDLSYSACPSPVLSLFSLMVAHIYTVYIGITIVGNMMRGNAGGGGRGK